MILSTLVTSQLHFEMCAWLYGQPVCLCSASLNFVDVYIPHCCDANYDDYLMYLSKISTLVSELYSQMSSQWMTSMPVPITCLAPCCIASA